MGNPGLDVFSSIQAVMNTTRLFALLLGVILPFVLTSCCSVPGPETPDTLVFQAEEPPGNNPSQDAGMQGLEFDGAVFYVAYPDDGWKKGTARVSFFGSDHSYQGRISLGLWDSNDLKVSGNSLYVIDDEHIGTGPAFWEIHFGEQGGVQAPGAVGTPIPWGPAPYLPDGMRIISIALDANDKSVWCGLDNIPQTGDNLFKERDITLQHLKGPNIAIASDSVALAAPGIVQGSFVSDGFLFLLINAPINRSHLPSIPNGDSWDAPDSSPQIAVYDLKPSFPNAGHLLKPLTSWFGYPQVVVSPAKAYPRRIQIEPEGLATCGDYVYYGNSVSYRPADPSDHRYGSTNTVWRFRLRLSQMLAEAHRKHP